MYIVYKQVIERISIECCKTKTEVITKANQNGKDHNEPIKIQRKMSNT